MKATEQMIDAACEACPGLQREQVAQVIEASLSSGGETPRQGLMKISILYMVLCGLLAVIYAALPIFVGFDQLVAIGFGLMAFLLIGGMALICAWLLPRRRATHQQESGHDTTYPFFSGSASALFKWGSINTPSMPLKPPTHSVFNSGRSTKS